MEGELLAKTNRHDAGQEARAPTERPGTQQKERGPLGPQGAPPRFTIFLRGSAVNNCETRAGDI